MNIYKNVIELATKKGWTIAEVERRAGLGNGTIRKWETNNPQIGTLSKVADALGVSTSRLLRRT